MNTNICSRNAYESKPSQRLRIYYFLMSVMEMVQVKKKRNSLWSYLKLARPWDSTKHKSSQLSSFAIHTLLFCSTMQQNVNKQNGTNFPLGGLVRTQPHSQAGVKFDPLKPKHELQFNTSRVFFITSCGQSFFHELHSLTSHPLKLQQLMIIGQLIWLYSNPE